MSMLATYWLQLLPGLYLEAKKYFTGVRSKPKYTRYSDFYIKKNNYTSFLVPHYILFEGHAVMIVVGVCVCLLVLVLVAGLAKLRSVQKKVAEDEAEVEMAWDDTALNITVNPLEVGLNLDFSTSWNDMAIFSGVTYKLGISIY